MWWCRETRSYPSKNAKKITYKPNASVRFENDTKLVLYALVKERPKKQKKKQKKGRKK